MIILIVLACLLMLGLIPLGICAKFVQWDADMWIVVGPFRFRLYPAQKEKIKASKVRAGRKSAFESHAQVKKKRNVLDYFPILRLLLDFLIDFRCKLRINDLCLKVVLAGGDPCDLSLNYARAWATLGNIMPLVERYFVIKNRNIEFLCDYVAESTLFNGYIHMTIPVWQVLLISIYHGTKLLRKYLQITRNAKDGAIS